MELFLLPRFIFTLERGQEALTPAEWSKEVTYNSVPVRTGGNQ
jgi:hypothetical protein